MRFFSTTLEPFLQLHLAARDQGHRHLPGPILGSAHARRGYRSAAVGTRRSTSFTGMTSRSGYCPGVPGGCPRGYCAADAAQVGCVILNRINPHRLFERSFGVCDFNIAHSNFSVIRFILQPCSFNNYEGNFVQHFCVTSTASALVS